mmetsp:Transcript_23152/g.54920  ORF Transcript_23152/g.54920 Transcript_23152/m.54920 type:complete len:569 (-) Transcript_23152:1549-3255(-)
MRGIVLASSSSRRSIRNSFIGRPGQRSFIRLMMTDDTSSQSTTTKGVESLQSLPNSIECRILTSSRSTTSDSLTSPTSLSDTIRPRLHVSVCLNEPLHPQQQQQQQHHGNDKASDNDSQNTNGDDGSDANPIPDSVLQYQRQLRKVQANDRSLTPLTIERHLKIIYEDEDLIVVDKPSGVLCVPGLNNKPNILNLVQQHIFRQSSPRHNNNNNNKNSNKKRQRRSDDCNGNDTNDNNDAGDGDFGSSSRATEDCGDNDSNYNYNNNNNESDPSKMIVHRLDMDTSGVVVFAKTQTCQKALQAKFRDKKEDDSLLKEYHALLCGHLDVDVVEDGNYDESDVDDVDDAKPSGSSRIVVEHGDVHLPLKRDHRHPPFMRISTPRSEAEAKEAVKDLQTHGFRKLVNKNAKDSHTEFRVLGKERLTPNGDDGERNNDDHHNLPVTRVLLIPHTGRTHQLRVHMSAIGHPIVGDPAYGLYGEANPRGGLCRDNSCNSTNKSKKLDTTNQGNNESDDGQSMRRAVVQGASIDLQQKIMDCWPPSDKPMCLHAARLRLRHPITNEVVEWCAPTPF